MNNYMYRAAVLLIPLLATTPTMAATTLASPTAPAIDSQDIANYGAVTGSVKWWSDTTSAGTSKGQTFFTGDTAVMLKAVTYQVTAGQKAEPTKTYKIRVGTVSGTTFTEVHSESATQSFSWNGGEYMTWTLDTPVYLAPNALYGVDVGMTSSTSGWQSGIPYLNRSNDVFPSGAHYVSGTGSGIGDNAVNTQNRDLIFHLDLGDAQALSPYDGQIVAGRDITLEWANLSANQGSDVWVDVWYGSDPDADFTKVVDAGQNVTSTSVKAWVVGTYYWRIDSYIEGISTGTPVESRMFTFIANDTGAQALQPYDGEIVAGRDITLEWANLSADQGSDVWVDVWYGSDPDTDFTKVVDAGQNATSISVNAPEAGTYYWRVDTYIEGISTGTPVESRTFTFIVHDTGVGGEPCAHIMICCKSCNLGVKFLVNDQWNADHNYSDIDTVRDILQKIKDAGITTVIIDMTNYHQWTGGWDNPEEDFKGKVDNVEQVCGEKGMKFFIHLGRNWSSTAMAQLGLPADSDYMEAWNLMAKRVWDLWAQKSTYKKYGYGDGRPILLTFGPAEDVWPEYNAAPNSYKTYFSKFYIGTNLVNLDKPIGETDGWGYRNSVGNPSGTIRYTSPLGGLLPGPKITPTAFEYEVEWASQATHYSVYGSYDDTCDGIMWGIADTSVTTKDYNHYPNGDDPYVFYNIVKDKLNPTNSPVASFASPLNNQIFTTADNIHVEVNASDEGAISNVELYLNNILVRQESVFPYQWGLAGQGDTELGNMAIGGHTLKAVATDDTGTKIETYINITVGNVNDAPAFTADLFSAANGTEGAVYSATIAGAATDVNVGDTLSYWKMTGPAWLVVATDGTLSGTPVDGDVGLNAFTVEVDDGSGGIDSATLNITVVNVNEEVIYTETFPNETGSNQALPFDGWDIWTQRNTADEVTDFSGTTGVAVQGSDFLYYVPLGSPSIIDSGVALAYTQVGEVPTVALSNLAKIALSHRADGSVADPAIARFAIHLNNQWYASDVEILSITQPGSWIAEELDLGIWTDGANWREMTVSPAESGGELTVAASAVGGTLSGDVTQFGIFMDAGNGGDHFRVNEFSVEAFSDPIAYFNDGTAADADALANLMSGAFATVSGLANVGFYEPAYITRTSFGIAAPAGPSAGSAAGSEWLSARSTLIHDLGSDSDYFGFTVTAATSHALNLTSLKFDMAAASGVTTLATGYNFSTQVYVSQDGGAFAAIGSPLTASLAGGVAAISSVVSANIDLSSITGANSVAIRIGVGDALIGADVNSNSAVGLVQGIQLDGAVVIRSPISLANMFSSGCVLQRDRTVAVWGTCNPNETITLDIKSQSKSSIADSSGNWRVELDAEPAGGPYVMTVSGPTSLSTTLTDVYFGDVWILTGQSNMFMPLGDEISRFSDYYPAVPDATDDFDDIRVARIGNVSASDAPAADVVMAMPWSRWEADSLEYMPIVGYFFARFLNEQLDANGMDDVPLGVIRVCVGGSAIEEWIAAEEIDAAEWVNSELILNSGASRFYNGMIAPFQDYAIKGALWYQGESNAGSIERIEQYPLLKSTLVESWREQWNNPDLPFYFVQLAPYKPYSVIPSDELWPWMRDSQRISLDITNTAMACIIDSGNQGDIHPSFKDRVGERLARIALTKTYGIPFVARGPTVQDVQISGSDVTITFGDIAAGLETRAIDSESDAAEIAAGFPPVSIAADELGGFALCGANQTFYWATQAEIISPNQVRISNVADVSDPVAIRYAWQDYPRCNLFNSEGLPAEPFRTDAYEYSNSDGADSTPHSSGISNQTAYAAQNSLQIYLPSVFRDIEDGGSNLTFSVTGNTAIQVVDSASVSNQILSLHFSGTSGTSTVTVSAQDSAGHTVVASFDLSVETTTYQAWRHEYFTVNQLGDSGQESTVWGDTADPDGDGTVNLLEYALALNPLESDQPVDALAILFENGEIKARFLKSKKIDTDPSVMVGIQTSTDLTDSEGWTLLGTSDVFYQDVGETELREILLAQDPETQFVRLVVLRVE
jgi:sialate O-acetylesterase